MNGLIRCLATITFITICGDVFADHVKSDRPARPYMGVTVMPAERGIAVGEVTVDSPAAKAGLMNGDRVIRIDNQEIIDPSVFLQFVGSKKPGDMLTLRVLTGNVEKDIQITLGEWPAIQVPSRSGPAVSRYPAGRRRAFLGIETQPLTPELKKQLDVKVDNGLVVGNVVPGSPAGQAGMKTDDVIASIDEKPIADVQQLRDTLAEIGPGNEATIQVLRGGENVAVKAKLGDAMFGMYFPPRDDRFSMPPDLMGGQQRIQELERRIQELERRVGELERKQNAPR